MDYLVLADQLLTLRMRSHRLLVTRELSEMEKGELFALNFLFTQEQPVYPKDLSRAMAVSSARIAALLNHMEGRGLVCRTPDPEDSRQILISLTGEGRRLIQEKRGEVLISVAQMLESLGPEDAEAYLRIQARICGALAPPAEASCKEQQRGGGHSICHE